jgi:hypothetical protein
MPHTRFKCIYVIMFLFFLSCNRGKTSSPPSPSVPVPPPPPPVVIQDSSNILGDKIIPTSDSTYKIRYNNFHDDINLKPERIPHAYKNYSIEKLPDEDLFVITPKLYYNYTRVFTRIIKYNEDKKQAYNITINGVDCINIIRIKGGYVLGLRYLYGGSGPSYFNESKEVSKIVWLNNQLEILKEYHFSSTAMYMTPYLSQITVSKNKVTAAFTEVLGCSICADNYSRYSVEFNKYYQPSNFKVLFIPPTKESCTHCFSRYIKDNIKSSKKHKIKIKEKRGDSNEEKKLKYF